MSYVPLRGVGADPLPSILSVPDMTSVGFASKDGASQMSDTGRTVFGAALAAATYKPDEIVREFGALSTGKAALIFGQISGNAAEVVRSQVLVGHVAAVKRSSVPTGTFEIAFLDPSDRDAYALVADGSRGGLAGEYAIFDGKLDAVAQLVGQPASPAKPIGIPAPGKLKCGPGTVETLKRMINADGSEFTVAVCAPAGPGPAPGPPGPGPGPGPGPSPAPSQDKLPGWVFPTLAGVGAFAIIALTIAGTRRRG